MRPNLPLASSGSPQLARTGWPQWRRFVTDHVQATIEHLVRNETGADNDLPTEQLVVLVQRATTAASHGAYARSPQL